MGKSSNSFKRGAARFKPQPRVLILCEDTKSALNYLIDAARHFRSYAVVKVAHCGRTDPLGIVEEAIRKRGNFERVYCVIDRDSHESFNAALNMARQFEKNVSTVPSYPCYEFWLLLHFEFTRRPITAIGECSAGARMLSELRTHGGMTGYEKGANTSVFDQLLGRLPTARANAAAAIIAAHAEREMNPSTEIHLLINELERLGVPVLLTGDA